MSDVEDDDDVQTDLGAAALAEVFQVEDVAEAKAADAGKREEISGGKDEENVLDVHAEERRD